LDIDWATDERGRIVAPVSTGFSLAALRPPLLALQVRCEAPGRAPGSQDERRVQFQISAVGARELAAALLHAAQLLEDSPEVGRLN
jgi:hypothetical protein